MTYVCYCPYCGYVGIHYKQDEQKICGMCQNAYGEKRVMLDAEHDLDFWLSMTMCNDKGKKISDFSEKVRRSYVYNNPLFKQETRDYVLDCKKRENEKITQMRTKINKAASQPKCPTCGSTNIRRISELERAGSTIMFGIFSNKRKYQFECLNPSCKYRW